MATNVKDNVRVINKKENGNPRAMFYKKPIKKDNYNLDMDNIDTPQELRRQRLLQFQKKCRDIAFNIGRGILQEAFNSEEDEFEEDMEIDESDKKKHHSFKRYKCYANQLMMSEWMLDVPQDLVEKWIIVPCPEGKRTLVVACRGVTKAYNKRGNRLGKFYSALPGGNPSGHRGSCTIIDCIWMKQQKTYYVLDVLAWSNQSLMNCDTEFRFFWLKSQLQEITELQERNMYINTFPILSLPNISCNTDLSSELANLPDLPPLDGLLFYHRDGQYTKGRTPLVTWLKPFMLTEVLGTFLPPPLDEKPDGYIDFKYYILSSRAKRRKEEVESQMDIAIENS
ncbi:PREDICTED: snurportin-1 [Dufourea novaeangliae]|uniref:Snurportin-1 n=1 Tax=Dufourea novaeangliae TaxID=178035 RepID=A0A154PI18_DUFNO|nr:PREDICTED: snurportin-1 [Dufourea novaeangliae]KZC10840.1 Snurportin-1 [Dufourea novaeangliae]